MFQSRQFADLGGGYCDSLSCLHAIEHFGLGRYGDPVDPQGYRHGIENMVALLKPSGLFYLSTPVGRARVEFNAHRVFDPRHIVELVESHGLKLKALHSCGADGACELSVGEKSLYDLAQDQYHLGIFVFEKQ